VVATIQAKFNLLVHVTCGVNTDCHLLSILIDAVLFSIDTANGLGNDATVKHFIFPMSEISYKVLFYLFIIFQNVALRF
jgi:hypothetical protein